MFWDHEFHPNQSCIFLIGVVYETLTKVFADVGAVVICFDKASHSFACLICVDVESVEEFADVVKGFELLPSSEAYIISVKR